MEPWFVILAIFFAVVFGIIMMNDSVKKGRSEKEDPPVKAEVLYESGTVTEKTDAGNAVKRAIVGSWLAGPVGAAAGAGTAKRTMEEHKDTTFRVYYRSGRETVETVGNGSPKWLKYMELTEK